MLSIGILGFIVWAQGGLPFMQVKGNIIRYMLEVGLKLNSIKRESQCPLFNVIESHNITHNSRIPIMAPPIITHNSSQSASTTIMDFHIGNVLVILPYALNQQATLLIGKKSNKDKNFLKPAVAYSGGASETTRGLTISKDFQTWFIGLTEGDGSWNACNGSFILRQKDPRVLYYIRKNLGFGRIILAKDGSYSFVVSNLELSKKLALIFNGNLVLHNSKLRYQSYHNLLLNHFPDLPSFDGKVNFPSLKTSWLSGITQANGGFSVSISKGNSIELTYYLDLKGEKGVLDKIQSLFGTGAVSIKTDDMCRYHTKSFAAASTVIDYFKKHHLVFNKHIAFLKWDKTYRIIKEGRLTEKNLAKIRRISKACDLLSIKGL